MNSISKKLNQFNDQNYYFELVLFNSNGDSFVFNNSAIEELVIEDDIFSFFQTGSLIFNNNFDSIERSYVGSDGSLIKGYSFGTTDRDYLTFRCIPRYFEGLPEDELDPKIWELNHTFVIYDVEDIQGIDYEFNFKNFYFCYTFYEPFTEKNINFSTTLMEKGIGNTPPSQQTDEQRKAYTGDIIREIITQTLSEEEKFSDNEEVNKWNRGNDLMFYTSHPKNNAIDDLEHVLSYHCSSEEFNYDPCFLSRDRYTNEWTLMPYSQYFEKAINSVDSSYPSSLQLEAFVVSEYGNTNGNSLGNKRDRVPKVGKTPSLQLNMHFSEYSLIDKFQLFDMTLFDKVNYLNTNIAHSYDYKNKAFVIQQNESNIVNTYNHFKENYSDKLNFSDYKNIPLFLIDNIRKSNRNIKHTFAAGYEMDNPIYPFGRNKILMNSLGLNTSIQFKSRGLTSRRSGHFISISKESNYNESEYESKLQGQWFLTKVIHRFTSESYDNTLFGVKVNRFEIENE